MNDAGVFVAAPKVRAAENENRLAGALDGGAPATLARQIEQKRGLLRVRWRVGKDFRPDRRQPGSLDQPAGDLIAPGDAKQQRQRHRPEDGEGGQPFRMRRHAPSTRTGGGAASD